MTSIDFGVYVIELDDERGTLYVGSTCKPFDERLAQHNAAGPLAARPFKRGARGVCLRRDLHGHLPRFDERHQAERAERRLANQLEHRGHRVRVGI